MKKKSILTFCCLDRLVLLKQVEYILLYLGNIFEKRPFGKKFDLIVHCDKICKYKIVKKQCNPFYQMV